MPPDMQSLTPSTPAPVRVPPSLGRTVDAVMQAFVSKSDEWCGMGVVEAWLPITDAGPARRYRVLPRCFGHAGRTSRIGVVEHEGWALRDATPTEEDELERSVAEGWAQIELHNRISRERIVLHQATGRRLGEPAARLGEDRGNMNQ